MVSTRQDELSQRSMWAYAKQTPGCQARLPAMEFPHPNGGRLNSSQLSDGSGRDINGAASGKQQTRRCHLRS